MRLCQTRRSPQSENSCWYVVRLLTCRMRTMQSLPRTQDWATRRGAVLRRSYACALFGRSRVTWSGRNVLCFARQLIPAV